MPILPGPILLGLSVLSLSAATLCAQTAQPAAPAAAAASGARPASGYMLMRDGQYMAAIDAFELSEPKTAETYNQMGIAAEHMFMDARARDYFERALRLNPRMADVFNNLGTVYYNEKQYGMAERCYKKALHLDSRNAYADSNLGTLYFAKRKYRKGEKAYHKAFALDSTVFNASPQNTIASTATLAGLMELNYNLARLFAEQSAPQRALEYLEKAVSEGFRDRKRLLSDPAFAGLHADPPFVALVKELAS